ncbi:hypothetical protein L3Y34_004021 [Caenorhabditis briggsae]|uniref:Major sperm protein n=2 Tax=Caenorhabditis briggsae TaxID=6238 RepID=A0AAE9AAP0_CAEBR|nr:hypothetical protein L3Y34_004021 [Caenorhabditis briggsae]
MSFGISTLIFFFQLIFLVFGCGKKKQAPTVKPATPKNENRSSVAGPPPPDDAAAKAKEEEEKKKKEEEEKKKKEEEEAEKKKKEEEEEKKKKEEEEKKKKEEEEEKKKKEEEEKKEKEKKEEEEKKKKEEEEAEKKKEEEIKKNESQRNAGKPHLTLEPSGDLVFKAESIAQTRMELKNVHTKKIMFKIKFSDNAYQANPVFGTIEPGKTAEVWITHNKSPHKEAKMVIVNSNYVGEMDLAKSFRSVRPTGGQVTVKLIAN